MKKKYTIASAILLTSSILVGSIAKADDDYENYNEYENYEYENHDDEDHGEYNEYQNYNQGNTTNYNVTVPTVASTWNIWTKDTTNTKGTLPFNAGKNVTMSSTNKNETLSFYVIPKDGEFFVPAAKVAKFLGADTTFFPTSKILEVKSPTTELIFRANTNVVYELNTKTPLPAQAFYMNNEIYVPISVITNGLGYTVEWQQQTNTFLCTTL